MRTRIACAASAVVLLSLASPGRASAQSAQPDAAALATRRQLIADATTARQGNDHAHALDLAERASRIQMTPSLRLFIAQEQQALGRLAEALGNADQCGRDAEADNSLRNRQTVIDTCHSLAESLRTQVGRVTVTPPSPAPAGLAISVSGNPLPDALWGVPYVVTPGNVVVEANATGYQPFRQEVRIDANGSASVQVALQARPGERPPPPPTPTPTPAQPEPSSGPGILPIVVIGAGAAGVIVGGIFGGLYFAELSKCPNSACPDIATMTNVTNSATTDSIVAWTAGGVGLALVVGGVAWMLLGGGHEEQATPTSTATHAHDGTRRVVGSLAATSEDRSRRGRRQSPGAMLDLVPTPGGVYLGLHGTF